MHGLMRQAKGEIHMNQHKLTIFTTLPLTVLSLMTGGAFAGVATYTSDSSLMGSVTNFADFNALVNGQSLLNYQEGGLEISSDRTYFSWNAPGFDGSEMFYPDTGALSLVEISMVDGSSFADLEMQVSSGWTQGAIGTNYIWVQAFDGANLVGEFDLDVLSGRYLGITGGDFDLIRIGSYASASIRDGHDPSARNAIAIDNLSAGVVPAPGASATLLIAGLIASRRRRA